MNRAKPENTGESNRALPFHTTYDWKGRVTRVINSDGADSPVLNASDQLYSYDGCGCAGGQVTTVQGELVPRDDNPSMNARRTQKIYEDILGRAYKTEVLNWDGTTPYTTTVLTFNGRDQVLRTRQYAGTTGYQDVTMTYDGHGRMKTRHYPVEDSETTWIYNADDSIQQVIDPRNAITNFSYNSRGLVEQISYDPPANQTAITDTPTTTFYYDALGNRTSMVTAGVSETTYNYNDISQLTSETVNFDDLSNDLTIAYTYELGGVLKTITDPFNSTVNYTNDKTGRLTAVLDGTPYGQNTTGDYASNIEYRAFGQVKHMDYTLTDDTPQIKLEYDNRLRVSHSEVSKSGGYLMKADYSYFADSRVQAKNDLLDNRWDRTQKFDFAGRLTFNQFGAGLGSDNQTNKRVYEQTIQYDGFSQMTDRNGVHWDSDIGYSASYTNGRLQEPGLTFDTSGNVVAKDNSSDPHTYQDTTYDAAGRKTVFFDSIKGKFHSVMNTIQETKSEYVYDGDGRPVIEKKGHQQYHVNDTPQPSPVTASVNSFQVWSSVLGRSLTKVKPDGSKWETSVYAGGALIAKQTLYNTVDWTTADPVTGTVGNFVYSSSQTIVSTEEIEPLGQKIRQNDPSEPPDPTYENRLGSADDAQWQCQIPEEYYGSFLSMPDRCGDAIYMPKGPEKPSNPHKTNPRTDPPASATAGNSLSFRMMSYALESTSKKRNDITIEDGIYEKVEIKDSYLAKINDSYNAEYGGNCKPGQPCPPPPPQLQPPLCLGTPLLMEIFRKRCKNVWMFCLTD